MEEGADLSKWLAADVGGGSGIVGYGKMAAEDRNGCRGVRQEYMNLGGKMVGWGERNVVNSEKELVDTVDSFLFSPNLLTSDVCSSSLE